MVRTVYNGGGSAELTLSELETAVTGAARNGGGWVPLVFHEVCSQTYDPADYSYCTSSWAQAKLRQMRLSGRQSAGED